MCYGSRDNPIPDATFIVRRADGAWSLPDSTDVPGWFGAVAIAGDGVDAHVVAMVTSHGVGYDNREVYLISKYLRNGGGWDIAIQRIATPGINKDAAGDYHFNIRALAYLRPQMDGTARTAITFTWVGQRRASAYAQIGIHIPTGTANQWPLLKPVDLGSVQDGDLAFSTPWAAVRSRMSAWCSGVTVIGGWSTPQTRNWAYVRTRWRAATTAAI
jgi:hypothetical protein